MWVQLRVPASLVSRRPYAYCWRCKRRRGKSSRRLIPLLREHSPSLSSPFSSQCTSTELCLTASPSAPPIAGGDVSEWTIWAGLLTGCPFRVPGPGRSSSFPPFPLVLSFLGLRYRPVPRCRRCAEVNYFAAL